MIIRPANPGDLEAILRFAAILRLAAATPEAPIWPPAAYESYLAQIHPEYQLILAENGGDPIGFIAGHTVAGVCELESIAVAPANRRSGLGTCLLKALTAWAASQGAVKIELEVRAGNRSAIIFYQRSHFQKDGRRPAYYRNPEEDALLMSLALDSTSSSFPPQID